MKLWVLRDAACAMSYDLLSKEPTEGEAQEAKSYSVATPFLLRTFCEKLFEKTTGIKLKPGQFCQIEVKQVGKTYYYED